MLFHFEHIFTTQRKSPQDSASLNANNIQITCNGTYAEVPDVPWFPPDGKTGW